MHVFFLWQVPSSAAQPQPVEEEAPPKVAPDQAQKDTGNQRDGYVAPHGGTHGAKSAKNDKGYLMFQPTYDKEYLESIQPKHKPPEQVRLLLQFYATWAGSTLSGHLLISHVVTLYNATPFVKAGPRMIFLVP